ncbi:lysylphosphatidylglycerol synthase domain-containing protein [Entomobacter blattae]|uniref:Lysylphosphatidylglycerol synthase TM region n=1 Tax=Entomobacter blattae TaxID=2762277 RepID=A0A7H1NPF4_9PROT|nr:lysylphosphatidylglycerol synthase domain-containing protein [Entomobacter blattae]QNT77664.1 Lysylphosphatidylglycerol synthase TM region [Entomobacter blattae]
MKKLSAILFFLGLCIVTAITAWVGFDVVAQAFFSIGLCGFILLILWQLGVDLILGKAWQAACPQYGFLNLTGARLVREAAIACLPFSFLGGLIISIRATILMVSKSKNRPKIGWLEAASANVIDITTEVLGLAFYVVLGVFFLVVLHPGLNLAWTGLTGVVVMVIAVTAFVWAQQHSYNLIKQAAHFLGKHIAGPWQNLVVNGVGNFQAHLDQAWSNPHQVGKSAFYHAIAWIANTGSTWTAFHFLGVPLGFLDVLAIEAITCAITSILFIVPGSLGIQEAAYISLGAVYGINADLSLSVSLLRRARDISIGIPALIGWQIMEFMTIKNNGPDEKHPLLKNSSSSPSSEEDSHLPFYTPKEAKIPEMTFH